MCRTKGIADIQNMMAIVYQGLNRASGNSQDTRGRNGNLIILDSEAGR